MVDRRSLRISYSREADASMAPPPAPQTHKSFAGAASGASSIRSERLRQQLEAERQRADAMARRQQSIQRVSQPQHALAEPTRSSSRASLVREAYRSPPSHSNSLPPTSAMRSTRPSSAMGRSGTSTQQQGQGQKRQSFSAELMFPQAPPARSSSAMGHRRAPSPPPIYTSNLSSYPGHYTTNAISPGGGAHYQQQQEQPHAYSNLIRPRSPGPDSNPRPTLPSLASILPRTMPRPPSPHRQQQQQQQPSQQQQQIHLPPMRSRSPSRSRPPPSSASYSVLAGPGPRPSERDFGAKYSLSAAAQRGHSSVGGWGGFGGAGGGARNDDDMRGQWGGTARPKSPMGWR